MYRVLKEISKTLSLLAGIVFFISGMAKSLDIALFSNVIVQYGFPNFQFLAPIIVLAEVLLGLLLIFQIRLRLTALIGFLMVVFFTLIYSYGLVFRGIEDCGCFGRIKILNTSPVFTYIRNVVLIFLLVVIWKKTDNEDQINKYAVCGIFGVMCIVAFMSGYGYRYVANEKSNKKVELVGNSKLKDFVNTSKDSTYLVFAFTYTCPHCMNSIENLKQYESLNVVDKVIGIAMQDSVAEQRFMEIFQPNFSIKNYPPKEMLSLTNTFPMTYYIRNDSIITSLYGTLPCGYVFKKKIK